MRIGLSPLVTTGTDTPMIFVPVMSTVISPLVASAAERSATVPSTALATASEYCASDDRLLQRLGQAQRLVHDAT